MGSYLRYLSENSTELIFYAQQHFLLVGYSVGLASVIPLNTPLAEVLAVAMVALTG